MIERPWFCFWFSLLSIDAESLAVFRGCLQSVLRIGKRAINRGLKPLSPRYKRIVPFLRQGGNQSLTSAFILRITCTLLAP